MGREKQGDGADGAERETSAAERAADMTPEQRAGMLATMRHADEPRVRKSVAIALGTLGTPAATGPLCEMLDDEDEGVRVLACQALGRQRDPASVPALQAHAHDGSAQVRSGVLFALASLAAHDALDDAQRAALFTPVVVMAFDPDDGVRADAAAVLGTLRDERAVEPLVVLAADDVARVRANAMSSLGFAVEPAGRPMAGAHALVERALDESEDLLVRVSAYDALGHRAERETLGDGEGDAVARLARQAIGLAREAARVTPTADDDAREADAHDADGGADAAPTEDDLRATAIWALGLLPLGARERADAVQALASVAARDREGDWCRRYAVEALARIGGADAETALRDLARRVEAGEVAVGDEARAVLEQALGAWGA